MPEDDELLATLDRPTLGSLPLALHVDEQGREPGLELVAGGLVLTHCVEGRVEGRHSSLHGVVESGALAGLGDGEELVALPAHDALVPVAREDALAELVAGV